METVTVPVGLLEELVALNLNEKIKVEEIGFDALAQYYDGRARAYQWILDNYPHE